MTWTVDPIGAFRKWRDRRRYRARVEKLRWLECELAKAEAKKNVKQAECDMLSQRAKVHAWPMYEELILYSSEVAELRKRVEHCKQDVFT